MTPESAFGKVLRQARKDRGLSQERLALDAGIERNYVSLLERGQNSASIRMLFKLAPILGMPASNLLRLVEAELGRPGVGPLDKS